VSDIDPETIKPGDLIRFEWSEKVWRVYEPVEERETAMYSGRLIGCGIKGTTMGGWKPARDIVDHVPRSEEFVEPEYDEQATLDAVADGGGG